MPRFSFIVLAAAFAASATVLAAENSATAAWQRYRIRSTETMNALATTTLAASSDEGGHPTVELSFDRFFGPVGDEGLTYSDHLKSLAGQRVRVSGYMVRES